MKKNTECNIEMKYCRCKGTLCELCNPTSKRYPEQMVPCKKVYSSSFPDLLTLISEMWVHAQSKQSTLNCVLCSTTLFKV